MEMPEIRYTRTADGVRIAYGLHPGVGRPRLYVPGPCSPTLAIAHLIPGWAAAHDAGRRGEPVFRFDYRGSGLSGPIGPEVTLEHQVADLLAVCDAIGEAVDVHADHWSCFPIVHIAVREPHRFRTVLLNDPGIDGSTYPAGALVDLAASMSDLHFADTVLRSAYDVTGADSIQLAKLWLEQVTVETGMAHMAAGRSANIADLLPLVRVPVLVTAEPMYREVSSAVAEAIPNASFVMADAIRGDAATGAWSRRVRAAFLAKVDAAATLRGGTDGGLSPRELEVLRLLAAGKTNAQIADALTLSNATVATHVRHILEKTGSANRVEAANWALRRGID